MDAQIKLFPKNDRFRVIEADDHTHYLVDTDDRKISILFFYKIGLSGIK